MSDQEMKNVEAAPADNQPVDNQPVEGAASAAFVSVGATTFTVIAFSILTVLVVAAPITWIRRELPGSTVQVSLWKTSTSVAGGASTEVYWLDSPCEEARARFRAVQAFAIISIIVAAVATLAGFLSRLTNKSLAIGKLLAVVLFITTLITWAMAIRLYYEDKMCGQKSYAGQRYDIDAGFALFVTGWLLSFVAIIVAHVDPKVPAILPDVAVDKAATTLFTVFHFIAFVFVVCGTPTQWFYRWSSQTQIEHITLWKYTSTNTLTDVSMSMELKDSTCGEFAKYAKFAQSFAIIAIASTLLSILVGAAATSGKVGKKGAFVFGFASFLSTILASAAGLTMYYRTFCGAAASLDFQKYQIGGGAAIFAAAFVLSFVSILVLVLVGLSQACSSAATGGNTRFSAGLLVFGLIVALLFQVIAANIVQFGKVTDDNNHVHYTYWQIETKVSGAGSALPFGCTDIAQRMNGAGALNIIAIFFAFVALVLGALQFVNANLRKAASGVALVAAVGQLLAWGLVAAVLNKAYCNNDFTALGYSVMAGLGLVVAANCITVVTAIVNLAVAPAEAA